MLRIISLNLNGIRSAATKGLFDWLPDQQADLVCLQELKAQAGDLSDAMRAPAGLKGWFHHAEKKGYSGVGIYSRHAPDRVIEGLGIADIDAEGRFLQLDFMNIMLFQAPIFCKGWANGLRYLRWGGDGEAVQPEKC